MVARTIFYASNRNQHFNSSVPYFSLPVGVITLHTGKRQFAQISNFTIHSAKFSICIADFTIGIRNFIIHLQEEK